MYLVTTLAMLTANEFWIQDPPLLFSEHSPLLLGQMHAFKV
jgi:hypothetical protein